MDWICDECKKPESEVGILIHGRMENGRDYQLCKKCRPTLNERLYDRTSHLFLNCDKAKDAVVKNCVIERL